MTPSMAPQLRTRCSAPDRLSLCLRKPPIFEPSLRVVSVCKYRYINQSGDSSELAPRLPCKGKSVRNRGVSQTMPFLVIPRSLLRGGFIYEYRLKLVSQINVSFLQSW